MYNPDAFTLNKFLLTIRFTMDCPKDVNASRWKAMLKWWERRNELSEPFAYPDFW